MFKKIENVLDNFVRPQLSEHYGDVKVISFEEGNLQIRLLGQCSGCPSAKFTVENIIESEIKKHVPEVNKVLLVQGVSDELLEFAKNFLNQKN